MSVPGTITAEALNSLSKNQSVVLLDVRTPAEFREVHATGARNLPLESLDVESYLKSENGTAEDPIYVICQGGVRANKACEQLMEAGREQVFNVEGGTQAWVAAGLPVVRGKKTISLERQVRIAAGSIAAVGSLAAIITGNVWFAAIPAFIGCGLVFAGVTDTCGMGMMLAKMPWNQCKAEQCATS